MDGFGVGDVVAAEVAGVGVGVGEGAGAGPLASAAAIAAERAAQVLDPSFVPFTYTVGVPSTPRFDACSVNASTRGVWVDPVTQLLNVVTADVAYLA